MNWTRERPTAPGFYWMRRQGVYRVDLFVKNYHGDAIGTIDQDDGSFSSVSYYLPDCEFYGPIIPPGDSQ